MQSCWLLLFVIKLYSHINIFKIEIFIFQFLLVIDSWGLALFIFDANIVFNFESGTVYTPKNLHRSRSL